MVLLNESYERFLKSGEKEFKYENTSHDPRDKIFAGDEKLANLIDLLIDLQEKYDFQSEFFFSVLMFLDKRKYVTEKQFKGLVNLYNNWIGRKN